MKHRTLAVFLGAWFALWGWTLGIIFLWLCGFGRILAELYWRIHS